MGWGNILVATDVRMRQDRGGRVFSTHPAGRYTSFEPLTRVFGTVTLLARRSPPELPALGPASGPHVEVVLTPDFSSLLGLARALPRTIAIAFREVGRHAAVWGRIPEPLSILAGWCAVLRGRPFIANIVADPTNGRMGSGPLRRALDRLTLAGVRALVRRSTATIYVTERHLQSQCPPPPGRPTLVRSNVRLDEEWFRPPRTHAPRSPARILHVGSNQSWDKGQLVLLDAAAILRRRGVDVALTFVGGGRLLPALRDEAARRGLGGVSVRGQVESREALADLLDDHDLFCLPSLAEGLPRAMIEAMARGLPAVGSEAGGIPELLPPDAVAPVGNALALADALQRAIADPDPERRSTQAVERARHIAEQARDDRLVDFLRGLPPLP